MEIYRVNFDFEVEHTLDDAELEESGLEEAERLQYETISAWLHVGAESIVDAIEEAVDYIDIRFEDTEWEITGCYKEDEIKLINWPGEDMGTLDFTCAYCKKTISLINDMWETNKCPSCGKKITRDQLIDVGQGRVLMVGVEEDRKKDESGKKEG